MIINELLVEDPQVGDSIDLECGDVLIETVIEDITEDGIVVRLDETAMRLMMESRKKYIAESQQNISEMDKSAPQPGRDGKVSHSTYGSRDRDDKDDYFKGKESRSKAITAKQAEKDALDILRKQGAAEDNEPKLGTVKANLMNTKTPTVQVQVFKHNTLRGDSYWVTKETRKFKTMDQAQAYIDRINKQGVAEGSEDKNAQQRKVERDKQRTAPAQKARNTAQRKGLTQDKDGTYYAKKGVAEGLLNEFDPGGIKLPPGIKKSSGGGGDNGERPHNHFVVFQFDETGQIITPAIMFDNKKNALEFIEDSSDIGAVVIQYVYGFPKTVVRKSWEEDWGDKTRSMIVKKLKTTFKDLIIAFQGPFKHEGGYYESQQGVAEGYINDQGDYVSQQSGEDPHAYDKYRQSELDQDTATTKTIYRVWDGEKYVGDKKFDDVDDAIAFRASLPGGGDMSITKAEIYVREGRVAQLPTRGADYSKYDTDHLERLLRPGILHRNELRFKNLIRKELARRKQAQPVNTKDLVVSLSDVPVKKPRGHTQYDPAKEFPGVKSFQKEDISEAEYQGRKVPLGKPFLTPDGPKKRSVYVKNPKGNVVKVNFGQKGVKIKKSNPARRRSFRARHGCDNPGPRHKARYWSCKFW